jgi:hypothetical protein
MLIGLRIGRRRKDQRHPYERRQPVLEKFANVEHGKSNPKSTLCANEKFAIAFAKCRGIWHRKAAKCAHF